MSGSFVRSYPSVLKWREERIRLIEEIHGNISRSIEDGPACNKEKSVMIKLKTYQQLNNQRYHDFVFGCEGYNTVSFEYNPQTNQWKFNSESSTMSKQDYSDDNKNVESFSQYGNPAADLLTKIHTIKRYLNTFRENYQFGRCIAILTDEISRFMSGEFKERLRKLHDEPDVSKTILQSICLMFEQPIRQLERFLSNVATTCAVGGFLLNMIKKERDSHEKCYHNFFHDMLSRAYNRGMTFYMEITADWLNGNNLDNDPFLEFFVWDVSKQRCSSLVHKAEPKLLGFNELVFLTSVDPSKLYNPIDVRSFKRQYMIVSDLCPIEFGEDLQDGIIKIGLYNHVLMRENRDMFDAEFKKAPVECLSGDQVHKLPEVVKNRRRHGGRVILRHLCNQLEFTILMEKLPAYFCGINNTIIDNFIGLTESFNWGDLSTHKNARLNQLNFLYQRAIAMSPLANDPLSKMILLEFSVAGQVDVAHPPMTNQSVFDRPLVDLELVIRCKDSFRMAFPPIVFGSYQDLFRLRHTLRRVFILLKRKHFEYRHELSFVEVNAIGLMIRFVQGYDNFVFGYKAPKLVHEYLELVKEGINKGTLDLDTFLKEQERMLVELHSTAFVSNNNENFSNPMWAMLSRFLSYASNDSDFNSTCIEACKFLRRIKRYLRSQYDKGEKLPELAEWLFGRNIRPSTKVSNEFRLCDELQKTY